ncbi:nuclear transport factor 2 family protein [Millisia brevis]|uniref:nuclear transport factor 2 family protein n=1 Tax=Millisia brevis TaxID=264148 RepID=UPI00082CB5F3|nr:nuclear transport factor 2 family protein [Millisia brevis]
MTTQNPIEVADSYFHALSVGEVPTAMALFSPNVVWHQPGTNRFSGDHSGPEAVGALIGGMMEVSQGTFALIKTGPAMANGALVAVPVRFTGKLDDNAMDMAGVDLLTIEDGRIVEVHLFSEDGPAEDAFWGRG